MCFVIYQYIVFIYEKTFLIMIYDILNVCTSKGVDIFKFIQLSIQSVNPYLIYE